MSNVFSIVSCVSVKEFFENEKEQTRQLLLSSVNSLIDSVFGQLSDKFVQCFNVQEPIHHQEAILTENQVDLNLLAGHPQLETNCMDSIGYNSNSNFIEPIGSISNSIDPIRSNSNSSSNSNSMNPIGFISNSNSQLQPVPSTSSTREVKQEPNWEVDEEEEEEDCDCDDCLNGDVFKDEENDEDEDSIEWIEENQNQESQIPTKRQRTSNEVPNSRIHLAHSSSVPSSESQVISLQCFQSECPKVFTNRRQLEDHLLQEHSITRYRCYVIGCQQRSFENRAQLNDHLRTTHAHLTQWQCDQCSAPLKSNATLKNHYSLYHEFGLFRCLFLHCKFVADCRGRLHSHLSSHREQEYVCGQCPYKSKDANKIVAHERAHAGIKPYYCKWPDCRYASAYKFNTKSHVRGHLKRSGEMEDDPKKYLGVIEELLRRNEDSRLFVTIDN